MHSLHGLKIETGGEQAAAPDNMNLRVDRLHEADLLDVETGQPRVRVRRSRVRRVRARDGIATVDVDATGWEGLEAGLAGAQQREARAVVLRWLFTDVAEISQAGHSSLFQMNVGAVAHAGKTPWDAVVSAVRGFGLPVVGVLGGSGCNPKALAVAEACDAVVSYGPWPPPNQCAATAGSAAEAEGTAVKLCHTLLEQRAQGGTLAADGGSLTPFGSRRRGGIPKIVWTFWADGWKLPPLVRARLGVSRRVLLRTRDVPEMSIN